MFQKDPLEVWKWFLFRKTVCRKAAPNAGYLALVEIEKMLGDKFALITQNVDGLHIRAGNILERMFPIHGDLSYARCGVSCSEELYPFPDHISKERGEELTEEEINTLKCPKCGAFLRPHVLWFDEYYNEEYYKAESALKIAQKTNLLCIIGTSGATTLPRRIFDLALMEDATVVVIDTEINFFGGIAAADENGFFLQGKSGEILPQFQDLVGSSLL